MSSENTNSIITIDDVKYKTGDLTEEAKNQLINIRFVDERLQQLNNELAVSDTARLGYLSALRRELNKK